MMDCINKIRQNATIHPERIAIRTETNETSYAELWAMVEKISIQLLVIKQCPKVVFDLNQGIEAYSLIIATLNVGGTFCPLNPEAPIERKKQIVEEFNPDIVVVESNDVTIEFESVVCKPLNSLISNGNNKVIEPYYNQDDTAYVIYTSGSTGKPKGVMISRSALNKFLEWSIPTYGANENDVWGQFSALSFDLSLVDIFTCLCSGSTLFSMTNKATKISRPAKIVENAKITIWHSIPSAIEFMKANEKARTYDFSSLRLASFCGETLYENQVKFLFNKNKDLVIFNTYGPTEGTLFCTWQEITAENYLDYSKYSIALGNVIPGWNITLDSNGNSEEKEIILYGDFIGKGYLGNVEESKFRTLSIENTNYRSFATGDLVIEENSNIFFSSRKDRQVKVKGFRVELDEVDYYICEFIKKTCITISDKNVLYTFIESSVDDVDQKALRKYLKERLEPYKVPNKFFVIEALPRNQNHKVDVNELIRKIHE